MMTNGKITVAVVGGYLLGRTKKAKLAFGLGMLLAGKKITLDPQQLKKSLAEMPLLSGLNGQVRQELVDATRQAATKAVSDRVGGLADSLHERTALLRGESEDARDEDEDEDARDEGRAEDEEPAEREGADADSEPKRKPKPPKPPRKTAAKAPARPAKKTAASGSGKAKKTAASGAARAKKTARTAGGRNG
ncbi:hypothetical protein [Streptomyces sp. PSAA01]|uniref:hypothetical protein n=1 Tax=Streptomyces sp. PSAA01 TaxID=2912762 RepID=UPI001F3D2155|nr:hypothetical protein [Streptomyces sp. PSAA01]MCG0287152.1 hypothetical protein [Streptomyces sp. PSAA01]